MKTKFEVLEISMDELHDFLKDADYAGYIRARTWAYAKLQENNCNMSKEYFAVFWNRLMAKIVQQFNYTIPKSVSARADYQRAYRQKKRERDALRLRKIRADEKHRAVIRAIPKETIEIQKNNLESLEELENRLGYIVEESPLNLALGKDLKT